MIRSAATPGEEFPSVRDREPGHFRNSVLATLSPYVFSGYLPAAPHRRGG